MGNCHPNGSSHNCNMSLNIENYIKMNTLVPICNVSPKIEGMSTDNSPTELKPTPRNLKAVRQSLGRVWESE